MRLPNDPSPDLNSQRAVRDAPLPVPYVPENAEEIFFWIQGKLQHLMRDFNRRVKFFAVPFTGGTAVIQLRPEETRQYLFIQNTHATQILYVGFGYEPTATTGMQIGPRGFYEPYWIPQNDIQVLANGAATTGLLLYAVTVDQSEGVSD